MSNERTPIAVAYGDGIGPEIMEAVLKVLDAAGARIEPHTVEIGEKLYLSGFSSGFTPESWEIIERTKVMLKAPITTPQGGGYKSLNVTMRKTLGQFANLRPIKTYRPFVDSKHDNMDMVIVRENEEDTYGGIEHRHTDEMYQCLKLISRPGCERIVRYAFEYAQQYGRKKVTCMTKDNIMKLTDGLFHQVFDEIGKEYPGIEQEHWIIDIGAAKLADTPEIFDVVVLPNLYGDIVSDIVAQISGSVGMAGGANIGMTHSMFEAIHGSAPRRAGQNVANPSGLLNGAVQMLLHINQPDVATKIENAWLRTLEDGLHTYDIYQEGISKAKLGTQEFAAAVVERLGSSPVKLKAVNYGPRPEGAKSMEELYGWTRRPQAKKDLVGVDVMVHWPGMNPDELAQKVKPADADRLKLGMISNRGTLVWPTGHPNTFKTDHWRLRYKATGDSVVHDDLVGLLSRLTGLGVDFVKIENLYTFDGQAGYTKAQGE